MKVLLVSHNCFSKTQNMGKTFASLFSNFKKEELMQLYLYPTIPNIDICDNYFVESFEITTWSSGLSKFLCTYFDDEVEQDTLNNYTIENK